MNFIKKILVSIISVVLFATPTWIYWFVYTITNPIGFWQNLILAGLGLWFVGGIQMVLLIFWVVILAAIWQDREPSE